MRPSASKDNITQYSNRRRIGEAQREFGRLFGRRYAEYRKQFRLADTMRHEPRFPLYLMLEQTYRCNLHCASCIHGYPGLRDKYSLGTPSMPWGLFERVILEGEKYGCPSVSMHTNDEPLLLKDLGKRVAFAREHGFMDVIVTTNGLLLTGDRIKELIDAGVTRILFSIDASSAKTYRKVRGNNLDKVISAIKMVRRYREQKGRRLPIIRVSFVPTALNRHEMDSFRRKFSRLADYIDIQPLTVFTEEQRPLIPEDAKRISRFRCSQPWRSMVVRGNGDVLPCCSFYGPGIVAGNLRKMSLYQVFNSSFMKQLRKDSRTGLYRNAVCKTCSERIYKVSVRGKR